MSEKKSNVNKGSDLDAILSKINSGIAKDKQNFDNTAEGFDEKTQPETETEKIPNSIDTYDESDEEKPQNRQETNDTQDETDSSQKVSAVKKVGDYGITRNNSSKKTTKRQKIIALLGIVVTFFVVVGVISSALGVTKFATNIVNSTALKEELSRFIFPLVIIDTPEFDSPSKLDNSAIVSSAIWKFIVDKTDKSKYQKDDLGSIYVPDVDIEYYIRQLFGSSVKIQHQSIDDASVQMAYDPDSKYYVVESTPKFLPYTPRIEKITKVKDVYTLKVSYLLPDVMWNFDPDIKNQSVDKIMEYKLKKLDKGYQVMSVKLLEITTVSAPDNVAPESDVSNDEHTGIADGDNEGQIDDTAKEPDATQSQAPTE